MVALVNTFRVKGLNDPITPVGIFSFQYQEGDLVVRMFRPDGNWMPAFVHLFGQPREEYYRGSALDLTFFVTVQKENSTQVGHVLEYTTSAGTHIIDLELDDAIDDEWPLMETPMVPQGEDPAFPNTKVSRRQFHPVELSVMVGGLEPEGPATFYSQDLKGYPAGRNYTIFNEGRWDHFHEPPASIVWVRAFRGGKNFVGNIVLPAGSSRVALDFDLETGNMTADVVLFPPSQSPLQEFGGPIRRVAPGFKAPEVYTLEVQITKEGVPTPSAMKSMYMYRSQQDTSPAAIYQILNGFNEKQYFSEDILGDWFVQAMDEEPPRLGSLRWPSITKQNTVLRFDLSESQQVRPDPGIGILSGSFPLALLTDKDSAPSQAVIRVLYRTEEGHPGDGVLITSTTCNADGTWQVAGLNENERFDVVARIPGYNDVIISNVQPSGAPLSAHFAGLQEEYVYEDFINIQVIALGGRPPYIYEAVTLPDGLSLSPDGYITGTMLSKQEITLEVKITDAVETVFNLVGSSYVAGDPYWDNVIALMYFDGNFNNEKSTLINSWNTTIDSTNSKFGSGSMLARAVTRNHIEVPIGPAGTEPFTLEFWYKRNQFPSSGATVADNRTQTGTYAGFLLTFPTNNINGLAFYAGTGAASWDASIFWDDELPVGSWNHIAAVRGESSISLFVNGQKVGEDFLDSSADISANDSMFLGTNVNGTASVGVEGNIDSFRFTKGVARYSESFALPDRNFPNY